MPKILSGVMQEGRTFVPDNKKDEEDLPKYITQDEADRLVEMEVLEEGFKGERVEGESVDVEEFQEEVRPRGIEKDEDGQPIRDIPTPEEAEKAAAERNAPAAPQPSTPAPKPTGPAKSAGGTKSGGAKNQPWKGA